MTVISVFSSCMLSIFYRQKMFLSSQQCRQFCARNDSAGCTRNQCWRGVQRVNVLKAGVR